MKVSAPARSWVEPEQLTALLDASDVYLRPIVATLAGAGLRVGKALALDWGSINLDTATLRVGQAKTQAGAFREVDLPKGLVNPLWTWSAKSQTKPDAPVFVSRSGNRQTVTNGDHRLKAAIKKANQRLDELGIEPISERVSPHSLRRTYASIRAALRDDPVYIAEQLGHTDPAFTFRVYQKAAKRRERLSTTYLEAFDAALEWARMGTNADLAPGTPTPGNSGRSETPHGEAIIDTPGR